MDKINIRNLLLDADGRRAVKDLMISDGDCDLMHHIYIGNSTAGIIAKYEGKSVQTISGRLKKLAQKGYITYAYRIQDSGGYEKVYRNIYSKAQKL